MFAHHERWANIAYDQTSTRAAVDEGRRLGALTDEPARSPGGPIRVRVPRQRSPPMRGVCAIS